MRLLTTAQFKKDVRRAAKRGKDLDQLWAVVEKLMSKQPLETRYRHHRLSGRWSRFWECHVGPDWLLIGDERDDALTLVRTGSHTDLFD